MLLSIIIDQIHYQKSDWSRAFNQFTKACELDMINAISVADIKDLKIEVWRSYHKRQAAVCG